MDNMDKILPSIALLFVAVIQSPAQGVVNFSNVGTTPDRHIYVGEYLTGSKPQEGEGYVITLWYGPAGTADENVLIQIGNPTDFLPPPGEGQFSGGTRDVPGPGMGPIVAFQARAWHTSMGATWAEAVANPGGQIGKGPVFDFKTKDPFNIFEQTPDIGSAPGWRGFAIAVPEPSTIALIGLAAPALLLLRRKR